MSLKLPRANWPSLVRHKPIYSFNASKELALRLGANKLPYIAQDKLGPFALIYTPSGDYLWELDRTSIINA